jgi:hypothetical protein
MGLPAPQPLLPPRERPPSPRRRRLVRTAVITVLLAPLIAAAALEGAGYAAVNSAFTDASSLRDQHRYGDSEAEFRAVAARNGPVYLLARRRIDDAHTQAEATDIAWAQDLAAQGKVDEALMVACRVADHRVSAGIALSAARSASADSRYDVALRRLDQVATCPPPADLRAQAEALRPEVELGLAGAELAAGHASEALTALDELLGLQGVPASVTDKARGLLPSALLADGRQALDAHDPARARPLLQRLVDTFGSSAEAGQARALLATPQRVVGTLTHHDGSPAAGVQVRLGSNYRRVGDGFLTDPPYYTGKTDAHGVFSIDSVPVGASLVLEFFDNGWTIRVDDNHKPADPVTIAPLTPVDLGFVREP